MKAAWDWELPRESAELERELVDFTAELGFDTLIVHDPTEAMVERGHTHDLAILAIVSGQPDNSFVEDYQAGTQELHPVEEGMLEACEQADVEYQFLSHSWFPPVHSGEFLCLEHEAALEYLEECIDRALSIADGVAFDGFGFRNHFACFCEACGMRRDRCSESSPAHKYEILAQVSEAQLLEATARLYDHATSIDADTIVTNHVWPPFAPNPDYGSRLKLDYCSQTIAWFYPPNRSLSRVRSEAREHARLAEENTFVPFIGMFDRPFTRRTPERFRAELDIALDEGNGNAVVSTLAVPSTHREHSQVLRDMLGGGS